MDWLFVPFAWVKRQLSDAWAALRTQRPAQLFVLLLMLALFARLARPDWYTNRTFHPDERWLFDKTAELHVLDVNAGFPYIGEPGRTDGAGLQYGSLPLYVVSLFKDHFGPLARGGPLQRRHPLGPQHHRPGGQRHGALDVLTGLGADGRLARSLGRHALGGRPAQHPALAFLHGRPLDGLLQRGGAL